MNSSLLIIVLLLLNQSNKVDSLCQSDLIQLIIIIILKYLNDQNSDNEDCNDNALLLILLLLLFGKNNNCGNCGNCGGNDNMVLEAEGTGVVYSKSNMIFSSIIEKDYDTVEYANGILKFKKQGTFMFDFELEVEGTDSCMRYVSIEAIYPPAIMYKNGEYTNANEKKTLVLKTAFWATPGKEYRILGESCSRMTYTGKLTIRKIS